METSEHGPDALQNGAALPLGVVTVILVAGDGSDGSDDLEGRASRTAEAHDGAFLRLDGAGRFAIAVTHASQAIAAAVEVQLASRGTTPDAALRIAAYTGEMAVTASGTYTEQSLRRAVALHDLAHPGQILASGTTIDLVSDLLSKLPDGAGAVDLGWHRLKDLGRREHVYQVTHPELADLFPPLRSLETVPNNLPTYLTSFVGRETELGEVRRLLAKSRLLTLTGTGGCGKTRLTSQVAADIADRFGDGVWWVDLGTLGGAIAVEDAVMRALGIEDAKGMTPTSRVASHIAESHTLVILDNCDHAIDDCRAMAESLLASCPNLSIITTSREPIGATSEAVWRVPPLSLPAQGAATSLGVLTTYDAVRLFIERARRAVPDFAVTNTTAPAVAQICAHLDGIPLAIELAAARLGTMSVESLLGGLHDRFRLLTGATQTRIARQQTLRASIEWSHVLLDEEERVLLRRLSVFRGTFPTHAVTSIAGDDGVDPRDVLSLLGRLVERSLLMLEENGEYRLLETIRFFAAERLLDAGEVGRTRDRHLAYHLALAEESKDAIERAADPAVLARLEGQRDNLRTAMDWALAQHDTEAALRLGSALYFFWSLRGHYADGQTQLRRALEHTEAASPGTHAQALNALGWLNLMSMDISSGFGYPMLEQAVALGRTTHEDGIVARSLAGLAYIDAIVGPELAVARLEEAAALARDADDDAGLATVLVSRLGMTLFSDRYEEALSALEELELLAERLDNQLFAAWTRTFRGAVATRTGHLDGARRHLDAALGVARIVGEPSLEMFTVMVLAEVEMQQGRIDAAIELTEASTERLRRGPRGRVEGVELRAAAAYLARGETNKARSLCLSLLASLQQLPVPYFVAQLKTMLGRIATDKHDFDEARAYFDEALGAARFTNNPWLVGTALDQLARHLRATGDADKAEDLHHEALALQQTHRFASDVWNSLEALGGLAIAGESYAEGTRVLAAVGAGRDDLGVRRPPIEQCQAERDLEAARSGLGEEAFAGAWAEGKGMSTKDAVAYVTRARGERKRPSLGWASLTPTEWEVVRLVARGASNPEIAAQLFVSRATVKTHLVHVFVKLGVSTRAELAAGAARRGI